MFPLTCVVALALLFQHSSHAQSLPRLEGLDRLYFVHAAGPAELFDAPQPVVDCLTTLFTHIASQCIRNSSNSTDADDFSTRVQAKDFLLTPQDAPTRRILRQVVASRTTARITDLWWALYDGRERSDVWHFNADPVHSEGKLLANYELNSVTRSAGRLDLCIYGWMFRPQGAWWIVGKTFSFQVTADAITFSSLRNDFGFFHGYELDEKEVPVDVISESEKNSAFEVRAYDAVPDSLLKRCGFTDPGLDEKWHFDWSKLEKTARCITSRSAQPITYRAANEPSFSERGGN